MMISKLMESEKIVMIVNKSFLTVAQTFGYTKETVPSFPAFIGKDVIDEQIDNGLKMFGYFENSELIGVAGYNHHHENIYMIKRLAVLPQYRHKGVGKVLIEHVENQILMEKGEIAEVEIVNNNLQLKNWYKKLGYEEIRIDNYDNLPFKACVMDKCLL
ncbi:acetyltransferase (GNAT) family protein [Chitinispirillum alkaliphilum]|nr:acetyltransferase (GNAT) family protein [Chitinispirillum alkaliphilum]